MLSDDRRHFRQLDPLGDAHDLGEEIAVQGAIPGMPVETFMQLGNRSVLSYLTKPLTDQIAKAWREK